MVGHVHVLGHVSHSNRVCLKEWEGGISIVESYTSIIFQEDCDWVVFASNKKLIQ